MTEEIDKHILRKYEIVSRLGRGAYGIVWKAIHKQSGKVVALKKIFDAFHNATDAQRTFREIMLLHQLNHDNIVQLLNVHRAENDRDIYLIFEHMETDLHAVIRAGILQEIHKKYTLYQTLKCLKFMHSANLIHRDMKPSNLLLNSECQLKVCDFGLARSIEDIPRNGKSGKGPVLTDYVATRWYRAPEILLGSTQYTRGVDMWSIGCILGELIGGQPLFSGSSTMNQLDRIIEVIGYPMESDIIAMNSSYAKTMLQSVIPPQKFRSINELFPNAEPEAINLLSKLLQFDPEKRITANEALAHPYLAQFHKCEEEPESTSKIRVSIDDNTKFSVKNYRDELYRNIVGKRFGNRHNLSHSQSHSQNMHNSKNNNKYHTKNENIDHKQKKNSMSSGDLIRKTHHTSNKDILKKQQKKKYHHHKQHKHQNKYRKVRHKKEMEHKKQQRKNKYIKHESKENDENMLHMKKKNGIVRKYNGYYANKYKKKKKQRKLNHNYSTNNVKNNRRNGTGIISNGILQKNKSYVIDASNNFSYSNYNQF